MTMTILGKIFGKGTKNELKARCPITKEPIEKGFGYLLTTSQIISSKKYWDMIMTEPETMSYTVSHFRNDHHGTQMRSLIFEKYSSISKPWMISDSCISLFENVDKADARLRARQWWELDGEFAPDNSGSALDAMDADSYKNYRDYAILEAGRTRISA